MRWPIRNQIMFPLLAVAIVSLTAVGRDQRRAGRAANVHSRRTAVAASDWGANDFVVSADKSVLRQMRDLSSAEFVLTDPAGVIAASTLPEGCAFARASGNDANSRRAPGTVGGGGRSLVFSHAGETAGRLRGRPERRAPRVVSAGRVPAGVAAGVCAVIHRGGRDVAGTGGCRMGAGEPHGSRDRSAA